MSIINKLSTRLKTDISDPKMDATVPELLLEVLMEILNDLNINNSHNQDHQTNNVNKETVNRSPSPSPSPLLQQHLFSDFTHRTCARLGGESVAHLLYNQSQSITASGIKKHGQKAPALAGLLAGLTPAQSAAQASRREHLKNELEAQIQEKKERDRKKKEELKSLEEREEQRYQQQHLRAATSQATASNQYNNYTYDNKSVLQQDQKWNGNTSIEDSNAQLHTFVSAIKLDTSQHAALPTSNDRRTNYYGEQHAVPTSSIRRTNYDGEQHSLPSSPSKLPMLNSVSMLVPVGVTDRYSGNTIDRRNGYGDSDSKDGIEVNIGIGGQSRKGRDKKTNDNGKRVAKGKTTNIGGKSGKIPPLPKAIHSQTWR